jgi:hypothetical protein
MASTINTAALTFTDEQVREVSALIYDKVFVTGNFRAMHNFIEGIKSGQELGFIGNFGLLGKVAQGCSPTGQGNRLTTRKVVVSPKRVQVYLTQCFSDLLNDLQIYSLKNGTPIGDLTGSDILAVISNVLIPDLDYNMWVKVWFSNVDAAETDDSPAGVLLAASGVASYVNIFDGIWKQIQTEAAGNAAFLARKVTPVGNSQATYALQDSVFTAAEALAVLKGLRDKATIEFKSQDDANKVFMVTLSIYEKYKDYLAGQGTLESSFNILQNGQKELTFDGFPVIPCPAMDKWIRTYENNGTKWNNPHRAVFMHREAIAVVTPSVGDLDQVDIFYDKKSKENVIDIINEYDVKVLDFNMISYAY